jgi:hypothetical protein
MFNLLGEGIVGEVYSSQLGVVGQRIDKQLKVSSVCDLSCRPHNGSCSFRQRGISADGVRDCQGGVLGEGSGYELTLYPRGAHDAEPHRLGNNAGYLASSFWACNGRGTVRHGWML